MIERVKALIAKLVEAYERRQAGLLEEQRAQTEEYIRFHVARIRKEYKEVKNLILEYDWRDASSYADTVTRNELSSEPQIAAEADRLCWLLLSRAGDLISTMYSEATGKPTDLEDYQTGKRSAFSLGIVDYYRLAHNVDLMPQYQAFQQRREQDLRNRRDPTKRHLVDYHAAERAMNKHLAKYGDGRIRNRRRKSQSKKVTPTRVF